VHGELADDGLARPGRGGYQDPVAVGQRAARPHLEVVELEVVQSPERGERWVLSTTLLLTAAHVGGIPVGRTNRRRHANKSTGDGGQS